MGKACQLWERSLELAGSVVEAAQPSVRIAKAIVNPSCEEWGKNTTPSVLLSLFQQAEIGLRIDISRGQPIIAGVLSKQSKAKIWLASVLWEKATAEAMD